MSTQNLPVIASLRSDKARAESSLDVASAEIQTLKSREEALSELCRKLKEINAATEKNAERIRQESIASREQLVQNTQSAIEDVQKKLDAWAKEQERVSSERAQLLEKLSAMEQANALLVKQNEAGMRAKELELKLEATKHEHVRTEALITQKDAGGY